MTTKIIIAALLVAIFCSVWRLLQLQRENQQLRAELAKLSPAAPSASDAFTYLAIGNSLTLHPLCNYWWNDKCGMAASEPERDYVHLVVKGLQEKVGKVKLLVHQFYVWEAQGHDRAETLSLLDAELSPDVKFISVQLGENVKELATYEADLTELLQYLKAKAPNAKIVVVGDFWSEERNAMRKRAAQTAQCAFADLSKIMNDAAYQCGVGTKVKGEDGAEHTVEHSGVAAHPGDKGMEYIAQAILKNDER